MSKQAPGRYYRRHRKIATIAGRASDGSVILGPEVTALITRYRYGASRRKPHYVYWHEGTLYRARNCATRIEDGKPGGWAWALEPIPEAAAWDAYAAQSAEQGLPVVTLQIRDGRAAATGATGTAYAGAVLLDGTEPADYVADLLGLEAPARKPKPEPAPERPAYRPRHMRAA